MLQPLGLKTGIVGDRNEGIHIFNTSSGLLFPCIYTYPFRILLYSLDISHNLSIGEKVQRLKHSYLMSILSNALPNHFLTQRHEFRCSSQQKPSSCGTEKLWLSTQIIKNPLTYLQRGGNTRVLHGKFHFDEKHQHRS